MVPYRQCARSQYMPTQRPSPARRLFESEDKFDFVAPILSLACGHYQRRLRKEGFSASELKSLTKSIGYFALSNRIRRGMTAAMRDADVHRVDAALFKHFASATA
jgi:hypothetical protein